jgi:hypothetical protein
MVVMVTESALSDGRQVEIFLGRRISNFRAILIHIWCFIGIGHISTHFTLYRIRRLPYNKYQVGNALIVAYLFIGATHLLWKERVIALKVKGNTNRRLFHDRMLLIWRLASWYHCNPCLWCNCCIHHAGKESSMIAFDYHWYWGHSGG